MRFHRPDSGLGFSAPAEAAVRAARKLESLVKPWNLEPAQDLLRHRDPNEAFLASQPGSGYAIYFPDGGAVEIDLRTTSGSYDVQWIDIGTGEWGPKGEIAGGDWRPLSAPRAGHWAAAIVARAK